MGAPKQKWTAEEEAALKAGIAKHGAGKWRTILRDPEFSTILHARSNVDLKDKWRNMNVMASGCGSRDKGKLSSKKSSRAAAASVTKHEDESMALSTDVAADIDDDIVDAMPLAMSSEPLPIAPSTTKRSVSRLDSIIMEAIRNLKEPTGSHKTSIAEYIEDQYWAPPDFKELLSTKLKALTATGKLIKVKRKYRIAPAASSSERRIPKPLLLGGTTSREKDEPLKQEREDMVKVKLMTRAEVDAELARMRTMTPAEAAAAAARAVAEAEAIMAEAEAAVREAEAAEADAEAAQAFAEAAMLTLKNRHYGTKLTIRA